MLGVHCMSCVFWSPTDMRFRDVRVGQCRISHPVTLVAADRVVTRWPQTLESDWCGEHATASDDFSLQRCGSELESSDTAEENTHEADRTADRSSRPHRVGSS